MASESMKSMKVVTSTENAERWKIECDFKKVCLAVVFFLFVFATGLYVGEEYHENVKGLMGSANGDESKNKQQVVQFGDEASFVIPGSIGFDAAAMIKASNQVETTISEYYGKEILDRMKNEGAFGVAWNDPAYSKGVNYLARNIIRELLLKKNYVIGVIGSSVAAAHDNCNYDSYEKQLQRTLSPIWKAVGTDIEVRNAGEGGGCGDNHQNQIYCVENMVGGDVDLVHYSWTYFEGAAKGIPEHELLLRWVLMMEKAPTLQLLNVGGEKMDKKIGCLPDEKNQNLFKAYGADFGYNAFCMEAGLWRNALYAGKVWGQVGDGVHNITRYGAETADLEKHRKESLGVVWRNWHPGPLGFQLAADMFALLHIDALKIAIRTIATKAKQLNDGGKQTTVSIADFPEFDIPLMSDDLIKPLYADPELATLETPPGCLNLEKPTYGYHQVSIVTPGDSLNPYAGEIKSEHSGGWHMFFNDGEAKSLIPKAERNKKMCMHLDSCGAVTSSSASTGWLVLKLPKMIRGKVILCGCCTGTKQLARDMFLENEVVEITFDGKVLDRSTFVQKPNGKCAQILDHFPQDMHDSGGHLYVGIRMLKEEVEPKRIVRISHVIAF